MIRSILLSGKEYISVMRLHSQVSLGKVKSILEEFCGDIYQRPPIRSSVKRRLRKRKIYYINLLEMHEKNVLVKIGCEAGTYIRKLMHDIGEVLGCGAHMRELRRLRAGPFIEDNRLVTLHDVSYYVKRWKETGDEGLIRDFIYPMEKALELLPKIHVRDSAVDAICHGAHLAAPGVMSIETGIEPNDVIALLTQKGEVVALSNALLSTENILKIEHGLVAKTQRVLMPRNVYPKMWRSAMK